MKKYPSLNLLEIIKKIEANRKRSILVLKNNPFFSKKTLEKKLEIVDEFAERDREILVLSFMETNKIVKELAERYLSK